MEQLDSTAEQIADLIWSGKAEELPVEFVEGKLRLPRHQVVGAFQDLERLGHGRFVPGRRSHPSRFIRGKTRPTPSPVAGVVEAPDERFAAEQYGEDSPSAGIPDQVFVLKRDKPFRFIAPGDLTRAEAERISRWLELVASD